MITRTVNKAFQEDEAIKRASEQRSKLYLDGIDKKEDEIPTWGWCGMGFALGVFLCEMIHMIDFHHIYQYFK